MIQRCTNPNIDKYPRYGGRGIKICKRWRKSFENFYNDFGHNWKKGWSIDRIDNNKDYTPKNCRWTTQTRQIRNRRNTVIVTLHGKTQALYDWFDELGIADKVIQQRIWRRLHTNWGAEKAFYTPKLRIRKN